MKSFPAATMEQERENSEESEIPPEEAQAEEKLKSLVNISCGNERTQKVFCNDEVWKKLGVYLSFDDLKDCRLVCQGFNRKVLETTGFKDRAVISLTLFQLTPECFGTTKESWKNFSIDVTNATMFLEEDEKKKTDLSKVFSKKYSRKPVPEQPPKWLVQALKETEYLKLRRESEKLASWKTMKIHAVLKKLFSYVPKLTSLSIDITLFEDACSHGLFGDDFAVRVQNLKMLDLIRRVEPFDVTDEGFVSEKSAASSFVNCRKLEVLKLSTDQYSNADISWELRTPVQNFIRTTAQDNKDNLLELDLSYGLSWFLQQWGDEITEFPALKRLKLNGMIIDQGYAAQLIKAQPAVQDVELTLHMNGMSDFFNVIQERRATLKTLRIEFAFVRRWAERDWWSFLQDSKLEELKITFRNHIRWSKEFISGFLNSLPLSLRRFGLSAIKAEEAAARISPDSLIRLNPLLLTELVLSDCGDLLTDATVEFICRNFKMIQTLNLSYAGRKVTDYGFTGIDDMHEGESQFSISDLRGLKTLKLVKCGAITDLTLFHIRFPELSYLDLSDNCDITHGGCREVISQNPSLRKLITIGMATVCEKAEGSPDLDFESGLRRPGKRISSRLFWEWGYSVAKETVRDELMAAVEDDDVEVEWEEYSEGDDDDEDCGDIEDDDVSFMSY